MLLRKDSSASFGCPSFSSTGKMHHAIASIPLWPLPRIQDPFSIHLPTHPFNKNGWLGYLKRFAIHLLPQPLLVANIIFIYSNIWIHLAATASHSLQCFKAIRQLLWLSFGGDTSMWAIFQRSTNSRGHSDIFRPC